MEKQIKEKLVHSILSKYAKEKGLVKYEYPDGFYCFGNPDCRDFSRDNMFGLLQECLKNL